MGRYVIVTGSSRGIGKAVADQLRADGFEVVTHSVKSGGTDLQFDIADREAAKAALENWIDAHGAPYGVVLNAGIADDAPFPGMEDAQWDRVLRTDLDGFYNVLRPLVLPMVQARTGGRIVVVSSISGVIGNRGQVNYSAAKAGLIGAAKALAVELAKRRITVNCVAPGLVETEMTEEVRRKSEEVRSKSEEVRSKSEEVRSRVMEAIPMRRFGRPEEVASAVSYLCSDGAAYVTRQVLQVNGGMF